MGNKIFYPYSIYYGIITITNCKLLVKLQVLLLIASEVIESV